MGDGDDATPGSPRASRIQRSSFVAAPWERGGIFGEPPSQDLPSGSHTADSSGVSVADLIAKVGGAEGRRAARRLAEAEPDEPPAYWSEPEPWPDGEDTVILPAVERIPPRRIGEPRAATQPTPKCKRRRVVLAVRITAALSAAAALAMTGGAYQWEASKNARLNTVAALDPNSSDVTDPNAQYGDENFLIAGVDSRAGANGDMGAGTTQDTDGSRSDTVILVNIPASRKRVVAVSFPRDLAITPIQCQAWDSTTGKYGSDQVYSETKLNSTYAFGGPKCLVKEIQKLSGLSINHFIGVDFAGFAEMVDALGGVQVCSTTPLEDYELGTVLAKAGRQVIDGRTALNYVRARQVTTEANGDYGRIKRQQMFLSSLLRAMISGKVLFSLSKLNDVVNTFIDNTTVDNVRTKDLVNLGQSLQGVAAGRVTFLTVPTGQTDADGNEPLRVDDNKSIFDAIINDDPLPGENNSNATTTPASTPEASSTAPPSTDSDAGELVDAVTTAPQTVTVQVSNSTGRTGLAATAAGELQKSGFKVLAPDDYPRTVQSTTVLYSSGNEQAAATVASSLGNADIQMVSGMGDVVQVVLGPDFADVDPPAPSGSPVKVHVTRSPTDTPAPLPSDLSVINGADTTCK